MSDPRRAVAETLRDEALEWGTDRDRVEDWYPEADAVLRRLAALDATDAITRLRAVVGDLTENTES